MLDVAPSGVKVVADMPDRDGEPTIHIETLSVQEFVGIEEVASILSTMAGVREPMAYIAARAVLYTLVTEPSFGLEVGCTQCAKLRGECRCTTAGEQTAVGGWRYFALNATSRDLQHHWAIGLNTLRQLPVGCGKNREHISPLRSEWIAFFLAHIQSDE